MDKQEFATLAMALRTYYPKEGILPNKEAMQLWYKELQDIPYTVAELALRKWVATNKWSPSIAELREMTAGIVNGEELTWGEAWENVLKVVRRHGSYGKREALASLDPLTRRCVENIGYMDICMSENIMVERAHFQKIFEIYAKRQQMDRQISQPLLQAISQVQMKSLDGGMLRIGGGHEEKACES